MIGYKIFAKDKYSHLFALIAYGSRGGKAVYMQFKVGKWLKDCRRSGFYLFEDYDEAVMQKEIIDKYNLRELEEPWTATIRKIEYEGIKRSVCGIVKAEKIFIVKKVEERKW